MITMHIRDGLAIKPDDCIHIGKYNPPVGTIIKFITEEGNEHNIITCSDSSGYCHECVFDRRSGHPLSKLFRGRCGPNVTQMRCDDLIYKPLDTVLEDL